MPTSVLFDVGNVIIPWSPRKLYTELFAEIDEMDLFLEQVCPMSWHEHHDRGVPMAVSVPERIRLFPNYAEPIRAWDERFMDMLGPAIPQTVRLMHALHAKHVPLYALTNMPADKADAVFARDPVFTFFRDIIISGIEGVIKPDPAIYQITLKRLGRPASDILFIDDSAANIAAARDMGFHTHHFTDPDALEPALIAHGLL